MPIGELNARFCRHLTLTANSGLGFSTCCRLVDEFLITRPQPQYLHLIFSTRDARKSEATLKRLNTHFQKTLKAFNAKTPGISLLLEPRIKLEGVLVDLTKLLTVKALAKQLLTRNQRLDAVVWNAGVAGWLGVNYPLATYYLMTGMVDATTYPQYMFCDVGALADRQLAGGDKSQTSDEPRLGQVFTANVFGHYMLTHWLLPLMDAETRIVWISSISATPHTFSIEDMQGVRSKMAYESSKRLTDLLVITSELPSTQPRVEAFFSTSASTTTGSHAKSGGRPQMYIAHPGVVATSISGLSWIMSMLMLATVYVARWIGSPWHCIDPYKGSVSAVFAVLAPPSQLADLEKREGKGKWGSATDVFGNERVVRTEIEGWGFGGELGAVPSLSLSTNRKGAENATKESREDFEEVGRRCWLEMEELRAEWEKRLGKVEVGSQDSIDV